jgi:hypothetical protein
MSIEGLPPVVANTHMLTPVSDWGLKLVSPLGSSLMSKDGLIELASRVYLLVGFALAAVIVYAVKSGYLTGRITPPDSSSNKLLGTSTKTSGNTKSQDIIRKTGNPTAFKGSSTNSEVSSNTSTGNPTTLSGVVVKDPNPTVNLGNTNTNSQPSILPGNNTPMPTNTFLTESLSIVPNFDSSANLENLKANIAGDVEKIHQNYDLCSIKLQSCEPRSSEYQELLVDFKRKIGNFYKVYSPYEKDFDRDHFLNVKQYERILIELNDIARGIIRVKGDGNCLFHSFAKAFENMLVMSHLKRFQVWQGRFLNHGDLRVIVNAYMKEHYESDATLKNLIDDAIIAHVEAKKSDISLKKESEQCTLDNAQQLKNEGFEIDEEEVKFTLLSLEAEEKSLVDFEGPNKYQLYFTQFEELGFFAAFAAAYSMCKILEGQIGIRIAFEPKDQITTVYDAFNEKAPILITLVFKGDHFDVQFPEGFIS